MKNCELIFFITDSSILDPLQLSLILNLINIVLIKQEQLVK